MAWIRLGSVCGRNVKKTGDGLEDRGKRQASRHKALSLKAFLNNAKSNRVHLHAMFLKNLGFQISVLENTCIGTCVFCFITYTIYTYILPI